MLYNGSEIVRELEWVIFDEVHYINDAEVCLFSMSCNPIIGLAIKNFALTGESIKFENLCFQLHCIRAVQRN